MDSASIKAYSSITAEAKCDAYDAVTKTAVPLNDQNFFPSESDN